MAPEEPLSVSGRERASPLRRETYCLTRPCYSVTPGRKDSYFPKGKVHVPTGHDRSGYWDETETHDVTPSTGVTGGLPDLPPSLRPNNRVVSRVPRSSGTLTGSLEQLVKPFSVLDLRRLVQGVQYPLLSLSTNEVVLLRRVLLFHGPGRGCVHVGYPYADRLTDPGWIYTHVSEGFVS